MDLRKTVQLAELFAFYKWRGKNVVTQKRFIEKYTEATLEGYAAVFAGAGLSIPSGYMNWKDLVKPLAKDLQLDIEKENDLISVMQYYENEYNRNEINQKILNSFTQETTENINLKIITKLPISTYWTTNYDKLLEKHLEENNKKVDIKISQENLAENIYDSDATVYKMHGDISNPSSTVITRDDYEKYSLERPLFRTALQGDLLTKTFLFIGFSFEDPNLDYILSQIRILLENNTRTHYAFFKNIAENEEDYEYKTIKQTLKIKDLKRYGIETILLNEYDEITEILKDIKKAVYLKNIFISGSIVEKTENWNIDDANKLAYNLSKCLVKDNYKVISGFGLGIGSSVLNGALNEIYNSKYKHIDENLSLRPFPQYFEDEKDREEEHKKYRELMLSEAGIAIFVFGNKYNNNGTVVNSTGMFQEFKICKENDIKVIPIGSTGGASAEIFNEIKKNIDNYKYLKEYINQLEFSTDADEIISIVNKIIENIQLT